MTDHKKSEGGKAAEPREFDLYSDEFSIEDWDAFPRGVKSGKYVRSIPNYHVIEYSAYLYVHNQWTFLVSEIENLRNGLIKAQADYIDQRHAYNDQKKTIGELREQLREANECIKLFSDSHTSLNKRAQARAYLEKYGEGK